MLTINLFNFRARWFEATVKFQSSSHFINPSHALPSLVVRDSNRISMAKNSVWVKAPAICLTTRILTESYLRHPTNSRYNNTQQVWMAALLSVDVNNSVLGAPNQIESTQRWIWTSCWLFWYYLQCQWFCVFTWRRMPFLRHLPWRCPRQQNGKRLY